MSTHNRIVLCDARGDELFSGSSLLSDTPPPPPSDIGPVESTERRTTTASLSVDEEEEPIPATLRSNVLASEPPVSRPIIVEDADLTAA